MERPKMIIAILISFAVGYGSAVLATMTTDRIDAADAIVVCTELTDHTLDCKRAN